MSQITRDLDLYPVRRQLELFEGRCSALFRKSIFGMPEAKGPKNKGLLKLQPPPCSQAVLFLKARWPLSAQHQ